MGSQTISDFHQGADLVDVSAFGLTTTQLQNIISATTAGDHTLTLTANGATGAITFQGIDASQLHTSDFILSHGTHGA
jgi:hypothetical protein